MDASPHPSISRPRSNVPRSTAAAGVVIGQLDPDHQPEPAHLADRVVTALDVTQPVHREVADLGGVLQQLLVRDHVECRDRGGAGERVPPYVDHACPSSTS